MSETKREAWGSLRKLPSGRWQARYPEPDGEVYTARTEDDKALTFVTKTDARKWLASMHSKISLGLWERPEVIAERRRAERSRERVGNHEASVRQRELRGEHGWPVRLIRVPSK